MATIPDMQIAWRNGYPTTDHKPAAETDWHRDLMADLIQILKRYYAGKPLVYVSGNLLIFYVPGNKRKHLAPDVFVVKGVPDRQRPNYLIWEEGKAPHVVIELTSSSTRAEDVKKKYQLYQDVLKVKEYFLFDPLGDYLDPPLRGYRLVRGTYQAIRAVNERLPSRILGLHLERDNKVLRLFDSTTGEWLPTPDERVEDAEEATRQVEAENERLRRELEELRQARREQQ